MLINFFGYSLFKQINPKDKTKNFKSGNLSSKTHYLELFRLARNLQFLRQRGLFG